MPNPYATKPPEAFWKPGIAERAPNDIAPIPAKRFLLTAQDSIATAGSCFAQNVAKHLKARGGARFLEAEPIAADQPVFSALFGNIYTARQLTQIAEEAQGARRPHDIAWKRADGRFVDALRPTMFADGFADEAAARAARTKHLAAVRSLFCECTVFIFTLGLTEAWRSKRDGTVYPLAPGVIADPAAPDEFEFHNFGYEEVRDDLEQFIARLKAINPAARFLLTVSPVPLTATYTGEHVLVATTHSKSILRAAASALTAKHDHVFYFPAYEIITGNFSRARYYDDNLRTITPAGVAHVMRVFEQTYGLGSEEARPTHAANRLFSDKNTDVICDEPEIVKSLGF